MRHPLRAMALALALALGAPPAAAQGDPMAQARSLFNAGAQAYERAQYQAAIQAFEEAYRLAPRPGILFSIAQAQRRQYFVDKNPERVRKAIELYNQYLAAVPQGGRRADVVQALSELEPIAARLAPPPGAEAAPAPPPEVEPETRLMISSQVEEAQISVDGGEAKPLPFIEEVEPGKHRIKVSAPGYFDDDREIMAVEGNVIALDVPLRERPALLAIRTDDRADISIDGRLVGEAPLARPIEVPPGRHLITVTRSGRRPFSREVDFPRGERVEIDAALDRTAQRYISYGLVGGGIVGVVVGGVFGAIALGEQATAEEIRDETIQGNADASLRDPYGAAIRRRDTWRQLGALTAGSGLAVGAVGVLLYLTDSPSLAPMSGPDRLPGAPAPRGPMRDEPSMEVSATPLLGPGLTGAVLEGRF